MDTSMATRRPNSEKFTLLTGVCTDYQLHKSQLAHLSQCRNVMDYTYFKLKNYIENYVTEEGRRVHLERILKEYKKGLVAIAWHSGHPTWINVTKEH